MFGPMNDAPDEHLIPLDELGHDLSRSCRCTPFVYERRSTDTDEMGFRNVEVRHNAFDALPVDEDALEVAQGRRAALGDAEGHS